MAKDKKMYVKDLPIQSKRNVKKKKGPYKKEIYGHEKAVDHRKSFDFSFLRSTEKKTMKVGDRTLYSHPLGYFLASNTLAKNFQGDYRAMAMAGAMCAEVGERLVYLQVTGTKRNYSKGIVFLREGYFEIYEQVKQKKSNVGRMGSSKTGSSKTGSSRGESFSSSTTGDSMSYADTSIHSDWYSDLTFDFDTANSVSNAPLKNVVSYSIQQLHAIKHTDKDPSTVDLIFLTTKSGEELSDEATFDFEKSVIRLRCQTMARAQKWIRNILLTLRDKVLLIDMMQEHLQKTGEESNLIKRELFLRLLVDCWALIKGPRHVKTADAQEKLANYLLEKGDNENEAGFWMDQSKEIKEVFSKEPPELTTTLSRIMHELEINLDE